MDGQASSAVRFPAGLRVQGGDPVGHHALLQAFETGGAQAVRSLLGPELGGPESLTFISSEGLFPIESTNAGALQAVVQTAGAVGPVEVVVAFREPASWALSWGLQLVLQGHIQDLSGWAETLSFLTPAQYLARLAKESDVSVRILEYSSTTNVHICKLLGLRWAKPNANVFPTPKLTADEWSALATASPMIPTSLRFESMMWGAEALKESRAAQGPRSKGIKPSDVFSARLAARWIDEYRAANELVADAGIDGAALLHAVGATQARLSRFKEVPTQTVRAMGKTWPDFASVLAPTVKMWRAETARRDRVSLGSRASAAARAASDPGFESTAAKRPVHPEALDSPRIAVSGPGRSGTSVLVKLFSAWGFRTADTSWHEDAHAGLESRLRMDSPLEVDKDPWAFEYVDPTSGDPLGAYDVLIVPIRNRHEAALSRSVQERFARAILHHDDSWRWNSFGAVPGGAVSNTSAEGIQSTLSAGLWDLLLASAAAGITTRFLLFPRFVIDFDYLWQQIGDIVHKRSPRESAYRLWAGTVNTGLLHLPSDDEVAHTARERELEALVEKLRAEVARLKNR